MRPAAAGRKAWSRFIFTYEVGPKEPLSANSTPRSEQSAFAFTPIIRTSLYLLLTFCPSFDVAVGMGMAFTQPRRSFWQRRRHSKSASIDGAAPGGPDTTATFIIESLIWPNGCPASWTKATSKFQARTSHARRYGTRRPDAAFSR